MALATTFEIDTPGFRREIAKLAKEYGTSARALMLDQMRLWMNDLIRKTWPKTYAIGRQAVRRDIAKVFVPMMDTDVLEFYRDVFGTEHPDLLNVELGDMLDIHTRWRNRQGRVRQGPRGTLRAGGIKTVAKYHVPASQFSQYLRIKQSHVGNLKRGWVPGAKLFKGTIPQWVMRGQVKGRAVDKMGKNGSGYLMAVNRVFFARDKLTALVGATAYTRQRDLNMHLHKRLQNIAYKTKVGKL